MKLISTTSCAERVAKTADDTHVRKHDSCEILAKSHDTTWCTCEFEGAFLRIDDRANLRQDGEYYPVIPETD